MNDFAKAIAADAIEMQRVLPGPIERVWAWLTESEKRAQWFASGEMEPRIGGHVHLRFHHADLTPHQEEIPERFKSMEQGVDTCGRITRYEPPHVLAFDWDEEGTEASEVIFELTTQGDDVLLTLTHRRLANRETMIDVAGGWHTHLGVLVDKLNGRVPAPFWATNAAVKREYRERL